MTKVDPMPSTKRGAGECSPGVVPASAGGAAGSVGDLAAVPRGVRGEEAHGVLEQERAREGMAHERGPFQPACDGDHRRRLRGYRDSGRGAE